MKYFYEVVIMNTCKLEKSKRNNNKEDEKVFDSSSVGKDEGNISNTLANDLQCTGKFLKEPKNLKPKIDPDDKLFDGCNEKNRPRKKILSLLSKKFKTGKNGNDTRKHASKVRLKESHLLASKVNLEDEKLFGSSTRDNDKVNNSNALAEDCDCTEQSLQEPKNLKPKVDSEDELFDVWDETSKHKKKLLKTFSTPINGNTKHASKLQLNKSHLLRSNVSKCDMCDRCFNNTTKLLAHKKIHSVTPSICLMNSTTIEKDLKSKPDVVMPRISAHFQCHICSYEAKQKGTLNRHLRVHSTEKRFTCEYCEYCTRHKSTLKTHYKAHCDIRDYECELCAKKFLTHQNLKVHKLIHTGERPHVCDLCNRAFVQLQHLYTHNLRVHWNVL